jgi:small subunit ribosomal protein S20
MPNTNSAKKRTRQNIKRTDINKARKTRVRSAVRKVEEALAAGDKKAAEAALRAAEPEIMRHAQERRRAEGLAPFGPREAPRRLISPENPGFP